MNNIIKSNFTSLNGLNNETIDSLISDSVTTKTLLVNGESILPTQSTTIDSVNLNQLVPSASSYCTDTVTTINNVQHHVLTLGINRGIGAYLNVQSSIATLNPNQSPYCNTTTTIDSNGDYHYSLAFNLPASATQNFSVVGTNTISYGTNASVTLTSTVDSSGNKNNNFTFNIPQGQQGNTGALTIGTTTTVLPNVPASVTNTGTSTNAILNFSIPKGEKGDKGDDGDSYSAMGTLISLLTGAAATAFGNLLTNALNALMNSLGLSSPPDPTQQQEIQALADLISNMQNEINNLQSRMSTAEGEITTLQSEMGIVQEKVQYQTSYTDYMLNEVTNFNSDITTTNGIFGETSRIGQNGAATFSSVKTSTVNTPYSTLRINGNVTINGTLTHRGVNGNYVISGANWEF